MTLSHLLSAADDDTWKKQAFVVQVHLPAYFASFTNARQRLTNSSMITNLQHQQLSMLCFATKEKRKMNQSFPTCGQTKPTIKMLAPKQDLQ